jgi:hypothetical protein
MASIKVKTNIGVVTDSIRRKLSILSDKEYLIRPVCFDLIDLMTRRIHIDGKAADGTQIGTYSNSYLKLRQERFKRGQDPKIIVSLTRQLENDWSVIATEKGYGIGFLNKHNLDKARWVEQNKGKIIFSLADNEREHAIVTIQNLIRQALND